MNLRSLIFIFIPIVIIVVLDFFFIAYPRLQKKIMEENDLDEIKNIKTSIHLTAARMASLVVLLIFLICMLIRYGDSK